jgi:thiol-disulfide isomerase/thioredoxin
MKHLFAALLGLILQAPIVSAASLGDPAAPLDIAEWAKGDAIDLGSARAKKVLVVEFWATWCGPCKTSIPHLSEIQSRFADRGVVVIGVTDEDSSKVKAFVDGMGDKMAYTVAIDRDRRTSAGYMGAYGINGIPHAFIVDPDGNIAWHGHPMAGLDQALDKIAPRQVVESQADKAKKESERLLREYNELAARGGDTPRLAEIETRLLSLQKELGGTVAGQKLDLPAIRKSARFQALMRDYQRAVAANKPQADLQAIETEARPLAPAGFDFAEFRGQFSLQRLYQDYYRAATGKTDTSRLPELARQLAACQSDNAEMLTEIAWALLTDEKIKTRDFKLALKMAQAAVTASGGADPNALDTAALAQFETGDFAGAVASQRKAIHLTEDKDRRRELEISLKRYEAKAAGGQ